MNEAHGAAGWCTVSTVHRDAAKDLGSTPPGGHVTLSAKYACVSTLVKAIVLSNIQNRIKWK